MFSNPHNFISTPGEAEKRFGIRVSLGSSVLLRNILSDDWENFHWFVDAGERDAVLADMIRRHEFSRLGDVPTVRCEPIDR